MTAVASVECGRIQIAVALAFLGLTVGCTALGPARDWGFLAEISDNPEPEKAYLIIGANILPADRRQPAWVAIFESSATIPRQRDFAHLSTSRAIFELDPGMWSVVHLDFEQNPRLGRSSTLRFRTTAPEIELEAGKIHYYGRLQVEKNVRRKLLRTVADHALYRRACEQAPEVFRRFPVVPVRPMAQADAAFRRCDELSSGDP